MSRTKIASYFGAWLFGKKIKFRRILFTTTLSQRFLLYCLGEITAAGNWGKRNGNQFRNAWLLSEVVIASCSEWLLGDRTGNKQWIGSFIFRASPRPINTFSIKPHRKQSNMASVSPKKKKPRTIFEFIETSKHVNGQSPAYEIGSNKAVGSNVERPQQDECKIQTQCSPKIKFDREFQQLWLTEYSWLTYDEEKKAMRCSLCIKYKQINSLTGENNNFRITTLERHGKSTDHKQCVEAEMAN